MDMFERYEEEFLELKRSIEERVKKIPNLSSVAKEDAINSAESDISEAEEILKSMDLTAKGSARTQMYSARVKEYRSEVGRMRAELRKSALAFREAVDRESLFAGARMNNMDLAMDQKQRLLQTTERAKKSKEELREVLALAEETVGVGVEALENLDRQKEVMYRIRQNLQGTMDKLAKARTVLRSMAVRAMGNKLIMAVIILALLIVFALIIYFKWFFNTGSSSSSNNDNPSPPPENPANT
eukprot:TRINITY_DN31347_c0_g1_i1.p1 TRINITY_DN31347_c0_g1~~TRINITY_DN31347_c0_g1_i1.p1  ORF type:complete len:242 (-),score=69.75 TRINITY_DN31347_c0_g1_i1:721-1446(-)